MKSIEAKSKVDGAQVEGNWVEKLSKRLFIGDDKVGPSTPAHVSTLQLQSSAPAVSARKLAASLWEFHQYPRPSLHFPRMHRLAHGGAYPSRRRHAQGRNQATRDASLDVSRFLADHLPASPDHQPGSASSLRRHIALTLRQNHRGIEKSGQALQPVSPASYGSSLEVAPYNPAVTPGSSMELRGRPGGSHYNVKTSTELLKVLNRIWILEEQHSTNMSLIRAMKSELAHARAKIKELLREQQTNRHEMDDMIKQIAEDKLARKTKEQDRLHTAIQSLREELEDERKLRKRSEGLHRKLARELSDAKSAISGALKELENERRSRKLLENLCDEFAKGIKSYEQEVRAFKQRSEKDHWAEAEDGNRLILHISKSWLDERLQMKMSEADSRSIVEKLGYEIETFLQAKRISGNPRNRRKSLESVPLNEAISAPRDMGEEEDSGGSDSNCFELKKPTHGESTQEGNHAKDDDILEKTRSCYPSSLQVKNEHKIAQAVSGNENTLPSEAEKAPVSTYQRSPNFEITKEGSDFKSNNTNPNHTVETIIRNHILLSESGNLHEHDGSGASCSFSARRDLPSPVRQWNSRILTPDLDPSQSAAVVKEKTLKAKLNEARSRSHRSRLRLFKGSS